MDRRDLKGYSDAPAAVRWPSGAQPAVLFVVNVEEGAEAPRADADGRNENIHEIHEEVADAVDLRMEPHFASGTRTGNRRRVDTLDADRAKATFSRCGRAARQSITRDVRRDRKIPARGGRVCTVVDVATRLSAIVGNLAHVRRRSDDMIRYALAAALMGVATCSYAETYAFKVMGQPVATGNIQKDIEQPFFENFAKHSGLDASADYKPADTTGIKDTEQLRILKTGLFDIISLRLSQVSRDEPTILGLDLVGLNPDYETGRKTAAAFKDEVDKQLQNKFNTKLLGIWPFGPQVLFCKPEIGKLADLKGKKVRVYDQNLAKFISSVGGTPVPLSFPEVQQSLSRGVVDCAITGPSSANSAGWPEVTGYVYPLAFQLAMNGYGINLDRWKKMPPADQEKLQAAFTKLSDDIWAYSKKLFDDAVRCNVGQTPCETGKPYKLKLVPVTDADKALMAGAVKEVSFPTWAALCDATNPGCSKAWQAKVGKN